MPPPAGQYGNTTVSPTVANPAGDPSSSAFASSPTSTNPYDPSTSTNTNTNSTDALSNFFGQTSGITQQQLAQQKAEFDAQLAFAQQQLQQLGIPQLQINQFLAQLQQQQFQSQLAQVNAQETGYYSAPQFGNVTLGGTGGGGGTSTLANGTFVKDQGSQAMGQIQNGQLHLFTSWQDYVNAGGPTDPRNPNVANFNASNVQTVPTAQFQSLQAPVSGTQAPAGQGLPTLAAQAQWAQLYGTNAPPGANAQTLASQLQQAQLSGMYNGSPTEAAREFNANLGQQYLATAAQLSGPQNTFQLSNYLRGAQGNPNVPTYLQSLANNTTQAPFQATGSTAPTPLSASGLLGQLGGGAGGGNPSYMAMQGTGAGGAGGSTSATPGWNYDQTLNTMQGIMNRGAQALGPGALERLSPDELQAFGSGLGAVGGSLPSFLNQYAQSRLGQTGQTGVPTLGG
jgi:hypothetical protein